MGLIINKNNNIIQLNFNSEEQMLSNGFNLEDWAFFDTEIDPTKVFNYVDGELVDISQTAEHKAKVKKQKKNNSYKTYQEGLMQLKSEDELNLFLKSCGMITQAIYDERLAVIKTDLENLKHTYLTEVADD